MCKIGEFIIILLYNRQSDILLKWGFNLMKKIKKLLYHNKKVFFGFLLLLMFTISLSFFLLLYVQFQKVTYKTISSYSSEFFSRIDTISQSLLSNIRESSMQMFYTSSLKNLRIKNTLDATERIIGLRDLGNFVSSSDILDSVIVYNGNLDKVFSSSSDYYSTEATDFSDQEAIDILKNPQDYPYLVPIKRGTGSNICYSFLFYEHQSSSHNALLVNIKGGWYESQLWGISSENDYIIINNKGDIVIDNNSVLSDSIDTYWPSLEKGINTNMTEGLIMPSFFSTQPGYLYHKIQNSDWYYVRTLNLNAMVPELILIRNFLFISLGIVSVFMIVFILYILLKVYFPFYSIQSIKQLHSGILPFGFSFPIFLVTAENCDPDSLQTILEKHFASIILSKENTITSYVIHSCTEAQFEMFLSSVKDDCPSKLYVSNLCFSPEDLIRSSESLTELRQLAFLYPENLVMTEALLGQCNTVSGFKTKDSSSLISALKAGNFEDAWNDWHSIFSSISQNHYCDFLSCIYYLNNQLTRIEVELKLKGILKIDSILENLTDVAFLHKYMNERFLVIANASASKKQEQLAVLSAQIDQYISTHYKNEAFTPQQVAEAFQMNSAYLNRQYRQSSGISITDAIHRIRIEHTCTLLSNTDDSIEMIASHVGYSNTKYFFVIFKKQTGLTPKQYRISKNSVCTK